MKAFKVNKHTTDFVDSLGYDSDIVYIVDIWDAMEEYLPLNTQKWIYDMIDANLQTCKEIVHGVFEIDPAEYNKLVNMPQCELSIEGYGEEE